MIRLNSEGTIIQVSCGKCGAYRADADTAKIMAEEGWTLGSARGHEVVFCPSCAKDLRAIGVKI